MLSAEIVPNSEPARPATTTAARRSSIRAISAGSAWIGGSPGRSAAAQMPTIAAAIPKGTSSSAHQKLAARAVRPSSTVLIAWITYWVENTAPMPATSHARICDQPTVSTANIAAGIRALSAPIPPTWDSPKATATRMPTYLIRACRTFV